MRIDKPNFIIDLDRPVDGYESRISAHVYTIGMLRYAITSGSIAGGHDALLDAARRWAEQGVAFVQLREKQLEAGEQVRLARAMLAIFQEDSTRGDGARTKLLVNGRCDVAVAAGADGVHLTSRPGELTPSQVRQVFAAAGASEPVVSVSCHTVEAVRSASAAGAAMMLFGPAFEKRVNGEIVVAGLGLEALRQACTAAGGTPVLALGGVTEANAGRCVAAGAAGIAGIRLFAG